MIQQLPLTPFDRKAMQTWAIVDWDKEASMDRTFGLLGECRLAAEVHSGKVTAVIISDEDSPQNGQELFRKIFAYGADEILFVPVDLCDQYPPMIIADILQRLITELKPYLVLAVAGSIADEIAARVSTAANAGLVTDAARLESDEKGIICVKNTCRGLVENKLRLTEGPYIISLKPKEIRPVEPDFSRNGAVFTSIPRYNASDSAIKVINRRQDDPNVVDIREADFIVAGGKGVGGTEGFQTLQRLAELLGASLAGSREAVDSNALPLARQIGLSGQSVSPREMLIAGVSGAVQFVQGIEGNPFVVAINQDRLAPIFKMADMKVLGDLHDIVPALIRFLEKHRNTVTNLAKDKGHG